MFEINNTDLLGRKGTITSQKGKIQTPCFVPVVHPEPEKNLIDSKDFKSKFGVEFVITSSYILRKRFAEKKIDLHQQIGFEGPIITDSGAYQSLVYGEIEITPESALSYQELVGSDFGVPLDIPISKNDSYEIAKIKVEETIRRCQEVPLLVKPSEKIWIGPIQGGNYLDLIKKSAIAVSNIEIFGMFAIGSVVEIMNDYRYETLVDIIITAKQYLDPSKPVHLFGAGHPSMFPLIVATGCDSFDSAAYSLYAQEDRYMTATQTFLLEDLEEFPCCCPVCVCNTPTELKSSHKTERMKLLAEHNLYVCQAEIRNIRRAIALGTLWELLENRSLVHPMLRRGFERLKLYPKIINESAPSTKKKGIFLLSDNSLQRPEVISHRERLSNLKFHERRKLILISLFNINISQTFDFLKRLKEFVKNNEKLSREFELWILDTYFGIIPLEISEVFPLTQNVSTNNLSREALTKILVEAFDFIRKWSFEALILIGNLEEINKLENERFSLCKLGFDIRSFELSISDETLERFEEFLKLIF